MEIMEAVKFVALYGLETVVIALVGVTLIAGLYQLIRDRVHTAQEKLHEGQSPTAAPVHEPAKRA